MANDHPTNLRMGFGYGQARAAGLGGIRAARSPKQVNEIAEKNRIVAAIAHEIEKDAEWRPFVEHWIDQGLAVEDIWISLKYAKWSARSWRSGVRTFNRPLY